MNNEKTQDLKDKILKGFDLAYKKLIIAKSKNNEKLVYSQDGKIVFVLANELKLK